MSNQTPTPGPQPTPLEEQLNARLQSLWERYRFWVYVWGGLVLLLLIYFAPSIVVTVHSGQQGVMFRRLGDGTEIERTYTEGLHLVPPWDILYLYDVRVQQQSVAFAVLSNEGLEVGIQMSIRYHPIVEQLGLLHKRVGPDYFDKIVRPAVISRMRAEAGTLTAEQIYSSKRAVLQQTIAESIRNLNANYLVLDNLLIENVTLPAPLQAAIENKARAQQVALEYDFRLTAERKEAERKRIEAEGIRDFQDTISRGISDALLRWRGIEATLELARSQNAKVVVIGGSKDGLPLILDTAAGAPLSSPSTPAPIAGPPLPRGSAQPSSPK